MNSKLNQNYKRHNLKAVFFSFVIVFITILSIHAQLTIVQPQPNQSFKQFDTITVEWTGILMSIPVSIYLSSNNGVNWELKATNVTGGSYKWVNTNNNETTYIIKVVSDKYDIEQFYKSMPLVGHNREVWYSKWSPDGAKIATASIDGTSRIFETTNGLLQCTNNILNGTVNNVFWHPNSNKITTAGSNGAISVYNSDCTLNNVVFTNSLPMTMSEWNKQGSMLAAASDDGNVYLFNDISSQIEHVFSEHSGRVNQIEWSPDGTKIVTAGVDNKVCILDAVNKTTKFVLNGHLGGVNFSSWSPDGSKIATASLDNKVKIWDANTGQELHTLVGHNGRVEYVQWSPDGTKVVSCSNDRTGKIWNANTGELLHNLIGHTSNVYNIEWSPDGSKIASASYDRTAKVWDVNSGNVLHTLIGHTDFVWTLGWSPDGHRLVTSSRDGITRIWYLDSTFKQDSIISSPFVTEKKIDSGYVLLYPDSRSAYPSTFIEIPIILTDASNLNIAGVTAFDFDLNFNNTLLMPVGFKATVVDPDSSFSSIHFENIPAITGEIARVRCRVGLGNAATSRLFLTNVVPIGGPSYVQTREGIFTLLGICEEGGTRLLNPTGRTGVVALTVNGGRIVLELDRAEAGSAQLTLTNQIGQIVYSTTLNHIEQFRSQESISTTNFSSGVYYLTFTTATTTQTVPVMLVK
jgi:WD40 repeat protein